jgi:mannose-6-phosphate isomerase-like protein (cupin superfamily)
MRRDDRGIAGGDVAEEVWRLFDLEREIEERRASGRPYREFLRVPALSAGIYSLPAGANDLQSPHDEDEVYYVLSGRGRVRVEGEERAVGPGSLVYVGATSEHSFFEIDEDITLLVFFASGGPSGG